MSYSTKQIYHNYTVLSPDGIEMFRCDKKKFDWYLRKGLATQIDDEVIRLLFQPKGLGWAGEHFYLQDRENKCCCCGSNNQLSKHHVVPYCYRKHMPSNLKDNNYFDVLPLCTSCHVKYEKIAQNKKQELSTRYQAPIDGLNNWMTYRPYKHARTLYKYWDSIPENRRKEMRNIISKELGKESISDEDLKKYATITSQESIPEYKSHGEIVVFQIESFQEFFEEWRSHFVSTMQPKHLPNNWEIKRDSHGRKK